MILWHRTSAAATEAILRDGFRDGRGSYLTDQEFSGVWLSDQPLSPNEGACGDVLLRVELACTDDDIAGYEWIEEGKGHREWLVPAAFVNSRAAVTVASRDADLFP